MAIGLAAALICLPATAQVTAPEDVEREATRETMQVIFESLRFLFQIDVSNGDFANPDNEAVVLEALRELDDQTVILASHGFSEDASGLFLASVMERYSLALLRSYEQGEPERVRQFLYGITDICIACHTRLPSRRDSPVAKHFIDSRALDPLPLAKRARIQAATRRFDDALDSLETLIETGTVEDTADLESALRTYLVINIRVKGDPRRPVTLLESMVEQGAPGEAWRRDMEVWLRSLRHMPDLSRVGDQLASAKRRIEAADSTKFPGRRSALVEYIAASSLLHRFLASKPSDAMAASEAHYLLGLAEYRIHGDDWLPQAELNLELAIVLAPHAPWAVEAYSLLVEKITRTYLRTPGDRLPPEVEERLRELRQAVERARPSSTASRARSTPRLTAGRRDNVSMKTPG